MNRPAIVSMSVMAIVGVIAGCGEPRYETPAAPTPTTFKEAPPASANVTAVQWRPRQPSGAADRGRWWMAFGDPGLDDLEERLLQYNQDIVASFQDFMAARAEIREAQAGSYPQVGVDPAVTRSHEGGKANHAATAVTLPVEASWAPDLWGKVRMEVRSARFAAQVSAAELANVRLTEESDLAQLYVDIRAEDALQQIADRVVATDRQNLDRTRALYATGIDDHQAVLTVEGQLATDEASAAGIVNTRAVYEHAVATLIGVPPADFSLPSAPLVLTLPTIPLCLPSDLLLRRPDIAAAERTLAADNAQIGLARVAYYPTLNLNGDIGFASSAFSTLVELPSLVWSVGASASETLFDGGLRAATVDHATASYLADVATYRQTVLTAFQQVEDTLVGLRVLADQACLQNAAVADAQSALDHEAARYRTGLDPYLTVLSAQATLLKAQQATVTLRMDQLVTAVQLIQDLGGGWDVSAIASAGDDQAPLPGR